MAMLTYFTSKFVLNATTGFPPISYLLKSVAITSFRPPLDMVFLSALPCLGLNGGIFFILRKRNSCRHCMQRRVKKLAKLYERSIEINIKWNTKGMD